jgi:hypothetical protein
MSARPVKALLWLHWRLFLNSLQTRKHRGELEGISRLLDAIVPILVGILLIPVMFASAVAGLAGGYFLTASTGAERAVVFLVGIVLLVPTVWVFVRPFGLVAHGKVERGELLRLLPIPRSLLRHVELLRALLDPLFLVFAPGLLTLPLGALLRGHPGIALIALLTDVLFLALLACAASLLALVAQLLLRDRRRGELVALIFLTVISVLGFLPQLFVHDKAGEQRLERSVQQREQRDGGPPTLEELPIFLRVAPSFWAGEALQASASNRPIRATLPLVSLALVTLAAYGASAALHRRLLDTPAVSSAGRTVSLDTTSPRVPLVSGPVAAVALVQLRTFLRTVRGKMAIVVSPLMGVMMVAIFSRRSGDVPAFFATSLFAPSLVVFICVSSLGSLSSNQFAAAGRGLILELLLPLGERAMLRGRALATTILAAISLALGLLPVMVLSGGVSLATALAFYLTGLAVTIGLAPFAALLSGIFPKAADLASIGQSGKPHGAAGFLSLLATPLVALPPAGCFAVALLVFQQPWLAPALVAVWLALVTLVAVNLLTLVERAVSARKENLALVVAGK